MAGIVETLRYSHADVYGGMTLSVRLATLSKLRVRVGIWLISVGCRIMGCDMALYLDGEQIGAIDTRRRCGT